MKLVNIALHFTWLAAAAAAVAQPEPSAFLVADLNGRGVNASSIGPLDHATLDGIVYFAAGEPRFGVELWRSDGTEEGTYLFADLCPGPCSSFVGNLTALGRRIYFRADDGVFGVELWSTDGTREGTRLVKDVCRGPCSSMSRPPTDFAVLDGRLFFAAADGVAGMELWASDGSRTGTARVMDFCSGDCGSFPDRLFVAGSRLFFTAQTEARIRLLLSSDGTATGTRFVLGDCADCHPQADAGGRYYFQHSAPGLGRELWTSDGGPAELVLDLCPGICDGLARSPSYAVWNGSLYFTGQSTPEGDSFLYRTDGTREGTELVLGGAASSHRRVSWLTPLGGRLFFTAENPSMQLYRSDGTVTGTVPVGPGSASELVVAGNRIFFQANRTELRVIGVSDAASEPLVSLPLVDHRVTTVQSLSPVGGRVFFTGYTAEAKGELWTSDGTPEGTRLVRDIHSGPGSSQPAEITRLGDAVVFAAEDDRDVAGIWTSDGSAAGTFALGAGPDAVAPFFRQGDELLYSALGVSFNELEDGLWRTDGTPGGTRRIAPAVSNARHFVDAGDALFFSAAFEDGDELWTTDGTEEGTSQVKDIFPGYSGVFPPLPPNSSAPHDFQAVDGGVLFAAWDEELGEELLVSDGTEEGTAVWRDICEGPCGSHPAELIRFAGSFYFVAEEPAAGRELWTSDGTPGGTALAVDLLPGVPGSAPHGLVEFDGRLLFFARGADGGELLWESDGTAAGTRAVADLAVDGLPSFVTASLVAGKRLFFVAANEATGPELWASAGTPETTRMLEIRPGPRGAYPGSLAAVDGVAVFAADDGVYGREPWVSEGTEVRLLADVALGEPSSSPTGFAAAGGLVFFQADDGETGRELWALERAPLAVFRLLARLRGALRGLK